MNQLYLTLQIDEPKYSQLFTWGCKVITTVFVFCFFLENNKKNKSNFMKLDVEAEDEQIYLNGTNEAPFI